MNIGLSFCRTLLAGALLLLFSTSSRALEPDEIALVVNSNMPDGIELAKFYAQQRHIPDNRILVLDLAKSDQMACRDYEDQVVPQVREFLRSGQFEGKIKCLVTFYGVPLRIDPRVNTADEDRELNDIRQQMVKVPAQVRPAVEALETLAKKLNPKFVAGTKNDLDQLYQRRDDAARAISSQLQAMTEKTEQAKIANEYLDVSQPLMGDIVKIKKLSLESALHPTTNPVDNRALTLAEQQYNELVGEADKLEDFPDDAQARRRLREIAQAGFGLVQYLKLLRDQADYLDTIQTGASFDNELSMVLWKAYPHKSFTPNPLHYAFRAPGKTPQTLMVTRLDAPTPELVKSIITTGIEVEQLGMMGKLVVDTRGIRPGKDDPEHPGFASYDGYLHDLADLARSHTKLEVMMDDKIQLLPAGSADHVAMYCGWYSVHNYVASCKFNPGAVGFHIASYELQSLRRPGETGWVRGLINDGVVGTLGPVDEPFLGTFPRPDDFFPLLMTGRLCLAEVYWKTEPAVSWMMDCVGDPLYTPYRKNHPLALIDLPERLKPIFDATPVKAR